MLLKFVHVFDLAIYLLLGILLLTASDPIAQDPVDRAHAYTRPVEFDFVSWTAKAAMLKFQSSATGIPAYLSNESSKQVVMQHLYITERILQGEDQLNRIYADPSITDKESASAHLRAEMDRMYSRQKQLTPLAEGVLQEQVTATLADLKLTTGGQPIPPVLYHASALPMNLIISPREHIEQIASISLEPGTTVDIQASIEGKVDIDLGVSSLVVPVGGIGVYPSMIMRTTDLRWLTGTIAHEWTHNFLTLRPLGFLYNKTPELRTMNETAASIVGNEVETLVLERYYQELLTASPSPLQLASTQTASQNPDEGTPPFDYRAEMHTTRIKTDELLADGKIEEAEAYMEARREFFWDNGYPIRKLNQAYFAFYGAYADVPGGAAGQDPVGPAVRALREQSDSLADFLNTISWMTSFEELQAIIQ